MIAYLYFKDKKICENCEKKMEKKKKKKGTRATQSVAYPLT
jgi:hypothetical protein